MLDLPTQPSAAKMIPRISHSVLRQTRSQLRSRNGPTPVASLSALARLLSSLAVLEQKDGKLNQSSLGAVTAALKLGGSITGFVAGGNIKAVAEEAAKVKGLEKIIAVDNAAYDKVCNISENAHWTVQADTIPRDCQKTMPRYSQRISRRAASHMSSLATLRLARVFCPALRRYSTSSRFQISRPSRTRRPSCALFTPEMRLPPSSHQMRSK